MALTFLESCAQKSNPSDVSTDVLTTQGATLVPTCSAVSGSLAEPQSHQQQGFVAARLDEPVSFVRQWSSSAELPKRLDVYFFLGGAAG